MKRRLLFLMLVISLVMVLCLSVNAMEGKGTVESPYIVKTAEDFEAIQSNLSAYYKLDSDLEVSSSTGAIVEGTFTGVFDGNEHTVTVNINAPTNASGDTFDALFGVVSGSVKNLTVKGSATGSNKVAGIVGKLMNSGNVDNCVSYVTVTGRKNIGGIVGLLVNEATITNCINYGSINGANPISNGLDMGGIVGCVWESSDSVTTISNCYNAGAVYGEGFNCGGICGYFYGGSAENCFNTGVITSTSTPDSEGGIYGKTESKRSYTVNGYFSSANCDWIGIEDGKVTLSNNMLESTGVAIYLGQGSGIRGEFHVNEAVLASFCTLMDTSSSSIEYGAVVSSKSVVEQIGKDLISQEAKDSGKVVFAPAMKNGEKQYYYVDSAKGEGFHSYRFALTGFSDTKESYNLEFVILGYLLLTDAQGNQQLLCVNTVKSINLASSVENTPYNAVNIIRVAEVTLADGDFKDNQAALDALNHIVSLKEYNNKIDIDGVTAYGHANATYTSHISSGNTVVFKISNTNDVEFNDYVSGVTSNGYEKVFENVINNNIYYTLKKGDALINAVYLPSTNEATITSEGLTALPTNTKMPTYETKNNTTITQIKLADDVDIQEGMSYVIHLADGTFFIIDGGWCYDDNVEADKLYNTLVALAGEGNDIVIAGWIFTHCHGDHIGTFNYFVENYHDKVTINQLLYNFPSEDEISTNDSKYMLDSTKQRYTYFKQVISEYLKDTEIVKLHSGYKFYYANAEIEILQTFEDLYPKSIANNGYDFNSTSTIFAVTVGEQRMIFLGDVSDVGASRLNSIFGSSLKSNFMQVAHHGLNYTETIKTLYRNINAEYILYPAPLSWYREHVTESANAYLAGESTTVKQIFISGAQTVEIKLPYDGTLFDGTKVPVPSTTTEVERPSTSVDVPDAYFDLSLENGEATDAKGNATVTVTNGAIKETTVEHNGESKTATAFTKGTNGAYYMTLNFEDITSDDEMGEFILGSSTFEIFLKLDSLPGATVGLITSCNGGGVTLYLRKQAGGQVNFQIGSTSPNSNSDGSNYSAVADMGGAEPVISAGELLHIVGVYDNATNKMKLFINGMCVSEADFGAGNFRGGSKDDYVIGIGYNPQYSGEAISSYTDYELYEARIYNSALTNEQVAQQYWNCIDNLLTTEAGNE